MNADLQLLSRYHQSGDAMAFRELVEMHAGMVFATAKRVTQDAALAEDVAQETFLQLARQSRQITESVAAWLHRVAWRRACNVVRADSTRKRYEDAADAVVSTTHEEAPWSEVEPVLDAVIDELPDELRVPLVLQFFEGRTQRDIATQLGVSQPTVSRAIETGLEQVRSRLRARGVLCGAGLGTLIVANSASAVPATLMMSLSKLCVSGIGGAVASATWLTTQVKLGIGAAALLLGTVLLVPNVSEQPQQVSVTEVTPNPDPPTQFPPAARSPGVTASSSSAAESSPASGTASSITTAPATQPLPPRRAPVVAAAPGKALPTPIGSSVTTADPPAIALAMEPRLPPPQHPRTMPAPSSRMLPAARITSTTGSSPEPVHELVHSFPAPPQRPHGRMARDPDGWLWGVIGNGGDYGQGMIYKLRADGSGFQTIFSFNRDEGSKPNTFPNSHLLLADDGHLWGTIRGDRAGDKGGVFKLDPRTGTLTMVADIPGYICLSWCDARRIAGGHLWGVSAREVVCFDRQRGKLEIVARLPGSSPQPMLPSVVADDRDSLWIVTENGGKSNQGTVCKLDLTTRQLSIVVSFTGTGGACPGSRPYGSLAFDGQGWIWGTTVEGCAQDQGTIFKVNASTGAFVLVHQFEKVGNLVTKPRPEASLTSDGEGSIWGTTSYCGPRGNGMVFKIDAHTGAFASVVGFTGTGGTAPGGPARGDLIADGAGGLIGACDFGGKGNVGTLYRVDCKSGQFKLLLDIADLSSNTEGTEPHGSLVEASDGWLWGVTQMSGGNHCGTVFKFNPVTNALVKVLDFTGATGPHKGLYAASGLISDGLGFLWGATMGGGALFKIEEKTGRYILVADGHPKMGNFSSLAEMVLDRRGFIWGVTMTSVYKVDVRTHAITLIAKFTGDEGPHRGSAPPGTMALDDRDCLWGCVLADRKHQQATVFKIDTKTDAFTTITQFDDARVGWSGWQPNGDMHFDGKGSLWFTGVTGNKDRRGCSLVKINAGSGQIEAQHVDPRYTLIASPVSDQNGVLWGMMPRAGSRNYGSIYTFDPATKQFATFMEFSGFGSQAMSGHQPQVTRPLRHSDGNYYAVTRYGGPGGGGTIFRLRLGPTPMTQEATLVADGRVELHGTIAPNGRDTEAAFEWGTDASLAKATAVPAGHLRADESAQAVTTVLSGLQPGMTYYFRVLGSSSATRIPQRGAVLRFALPDTLVKADKPEKEAAASMKPEEAMKNGAPKYSLKVNRVPGAGAGLVHGALEGSSYEAGRRYFLSAKGDNGYVFDHWSGPGITGAQAESAQLSFVFGDELIKSPMITATFVRNPFGESRTGGFHGLVRPVEGEAMTAGNTGVVRLMVAGDGRFTGVLRYDGSTLPFSGAFDHGGLARFGPARASAWALQRGEKPTLVLSMQMNLHSAVHGVAGAVGTTDGSALTVRSTFAAERDGYDGTRRVVPGGLLGDGGRYELAIEHESGAADGHLLLSPAGSTVLAAKLPDGAGVLAHAALSETNRAAFFAPSDGAGQGCAFGELSIEEVNGSDESNAQPFWWIRPEQASTTLSIRRAKKDAR